MRQAPSASGMGGVGGLGSLSELSALRQKTEGMCGRTRQPGQEAFEVKGL